jgi:hypothetical protein
MTERQKKEAAKRLEQGKPQGLEQTGGLQNSEAEKKRKENFGKTGGLQNSEEEKKRKEDFGKTGGLGESGGLGEVGPIGATGAVGAPAEEPTMDAYDKGFQTLDQAGVEKVGDYERDLQELGQLRKQTIADTSMPQEEKSKLFGDIAQQPAMQKKQARVGLMEEAKKLSKGGMLDEAAQEKLFEKGKLGQANLTEGEMKKAFSREDLIKDRATEKELGYLQRFEGKLGGGLGAYDQKVRLGQQDRAAGKPFVARNLLTGAAGESRSITSPETRMINKAARMARLAKRKGLNPAALVNPLLAQAGQMGKYRPSITSQSDRKRDVLQSMASAERAGKTRSLLGDIMESKRATASAEAGVAEKKNSLLEELMRERKAGGYKYGNA